MGSVWRQLAVCGRGAVAVATLAVWGCAVDGDAVGGRGALLVEEAEPGTTINWGQYRRSPRKTAYNPFEATITGDTVRGLELAWSHALAERAAEPAGLAFHSDRVFVQGEAPVVLDAADGGELFTAPDALRPGQTPAYLNASAFFAGEEALFSLVARNGERGVEQALEAGLVVREVLTREFEDGTKRVYVATQSEADGTLALAAYDGENGAEAFSISLGETDADRPVVSAPSLAHEVVYLVVEDALFAFDALDGTELWSADFDRPRREGFSVPAVRFGRVFVHHGDHLYGFDAETGERLFRRRAGGIGGGLVVDDGFLYVTRDKMTAGVPRTVLELRDLDDGRVYKSLTVLGKRTGELVAAADLAYLPMDFGKRSYLCIFEMTRRRLVIREELVLERDLLPPGARSAGPFGSPVVTEGSVYVSTPSHVFALRLDD